MKTLRYPITREQKRADTPAWRTLAHGTLKTIAFWVGTIVFFVALVTSW